MSNLSDDQIIAEYLDFVNRCRAELKHAVNVAHEKHRPSSEEGKAVYTWCVGLGALCHDIAGACADLIKARHYRASQILERCLFEYSIRLQYYRLEEAKALEAVTALAPALRRLFEHEDHLDPDHASALSAADREDLAKWMETVEGKPGREVFFEMMKRVNPEQGEAVYRAVYGRGSAFVHGDVLSIMDLIGADFEGDPETHIRWQTKWSDPPRQLRWLTRSILWTLRSVEKITDRGSSFERLDAEFEALNKRLGFK